MKTTILSALLSLAVTSTSAHATSTVTNYYGSSKMRVDYVWLSLFREPIREFKAVNVDLRAEFTELENGKGTMRITSEATKGCSGFSFLIYAEQDSFGSYDLYANKEAWTNGEKLGSAIKQGAQLQLSFFKDDLILNSLGKKSYKCGYYLGENFYAELSKK